MRRSNLIVQRAARYPIAARLLWRPQGTLQWSTATSVNASRTGVLFETDQTVAVGTEVELIFAFGWDAEAVTAQAADVLCVGRIVRAERLPAAGRPGLTAAAIENYAFIAQQ